MSQRVRIIAVSAFVVVLALGAGVFVLRGQASSSPAVKTIKPLHPVKHHVRASARRGARKEATRRKTQAVIDGMPADLALALARYDVVVVSLYAPRSSVDELATAEARRGAELAGAGFVALSVADEKVVAPLTSLLTGGQTAADRVPDAPAVLVFQRPKSLFVRFNGFTDRDTVAQAATNASAAQLTASSPTLDWAARANAICRKMTADIVALPFPTSSATVLDWADRLEGVIGGAVADLHGLTPPAGHAAQVNELLGDYDRAVAGLHKLLSAARHGRRVDAASFQRKLSALGRRADELAGDLGATSCGAGA